MFFMNPETSPLQAPQPAGNHPAPLSVHQPARRGRPNGKVARLPKAVRDQINGWLLDGLSYPEIIQRLGPQGKNLTPNNLSQWKKRAHQDWLVQQMFVDRAQVLAETPLDVARDFNAAEVNRAALQLGALHMFEALRDLGPGSLDQKLGGDSMAFFRLIAALARSSRPSLQPEPYRQACARAREALAPLRDPQQKPDAARLRTILLQVDDILSLH